MNILIVGYRGYGYSEGTPTEEGLMIDSEAILDFILNKRDSEVSKYVNVNNVYVFGRSLGGAVALYIVDKLKPEIKGLIIENTFLSMDDMVDNIFPYLRIFKKWMLRNYWPSKERIANINLPILFLMSELDELVPFQHMQILYDLSKNSVYKQKVY